MSVASVKNRDLNWQDVCGLDDLVAGTGVSALLQGEQIAIFSIPDETQTEGEKIYALGNHCPFSRANVIYRGIIGDLQGRLVVASPVYKQHFDLTTGVCLEDESVSLPVYPAAIEKGRVLLAFQHQALT